jgi:small subunit ribosomal protein S13
MADKRNINKKIARQSVSRDNSRPLYYHRSEDGIITEELTTEELLTLHLRPRPQPRQEVNPLQGLSRERGSFLLELVRQHGGYLRDYRPHRDVSRPVGIVRGNPRRDATLFKQGYTASTSDRPLPQGSWPVAYDAYTGRVTSIRTVDETRLAWYENNRKLADNNGERVVRTFARHRKIIGLRRCKLSQSRVKLVVRTPRHAPSVRPSVRLWGIQITGNATLLTGLQSIPGIGRYRAELLIKLLPNKVSRMYQLRDTDLEILTRELEYRRTKSGWLIGIQVTRSMEAHIAEEVRIGSFRGIRHRLQLPVRGQRTRSNAATQRRMKRVW